MNPRLSRGSSVKKYLLSIDLEYQLLLNITATTILTFYYGACVVKTFSPRPYYGKLAMH